MSTIKSDNSNLILNADGASKDIKFQANGVEKMSISSTGKVALCGSTAVTVDSQVAIHGGNLELTTAGARYWIPRASDGVLTGSLYSPTGSELRLSGGGTSSGSISFEPSSTSGTAMTINNAGNVGIGTTSPNEKLHISGSSTSDVTLLKIENTNTTGDTGSARIEGWVGNGELGWLEWERTAAAYNHSAFKVSTRGGTGQITERMRIDSAGRVTMPYQPALMGGIRDHNTSGTHAGSGQCALYADGMSRGLSVINNRVTVPVAGAYAVYGRQLNQGGARYFKLEHNGSVKDYGYQNSSGQFGDYTCQAVLDMAANDYVTFSYNTSSTNRWEGAHSSFVMYLIG